jgi:hypothetical protein
MYYLWHPRLTSNVDLEATLTASESFSLGNPGREFFEGLLETLHVNTRLERWEAMAYRSSYLGQEDAEDWRDRWPTNWRIRMRLASPVTQFARFKHESIEVDTIPELSSNVPDETPPSPCIVCADFQNDSHSLAARDRIIKSEKLGRLQRELQFPDLSFQRIVLGPSLLQDQITTGVVSPELLAAGFEYGMEIERLCVTCAGICTFERRVAEWGELYDEDGI